MENVKQASTEGKKEPTGQTALVHDTDKENNSTGKIEVKTVLSERGVTHLECVVYWFWNNLTGLSITDKLMKMLMVYAKVNPQVPHETTADMVEIISEIIQLHEQLSEIVEFETVWDWKDTYNGWYKPC